MSNDFAAGNGFGASSMPHFEELNKALEAGYQVGAGKTGGSALRVESLEAALKVVTYNANHIKLWKKIPKSPAYSTVEEYNQLTDYGGAAFPFVGEGELPQASDSSYIRKMQLVKYMGTTREVTHQAALVHPAHGDLIALENQNGILWLLERVEQFLFSGDSSLAFDGEAEQWDGLDSLIDPTMILDLEGQPLQQSDFEEATNLILENYGFATDVFLGTRVMSDLAKTFYSQQRTHMPVPAGMKIGYTVGSVATQAGDLELVPDVFLRKRPVPPAAATSVNAPAAPLSVTGAVVAATTADFDKGAVAGANDYAYAVTACNRFGESAPTFISAAVTITAAEKTGNDLIRLTVTNPASLGAFAPEYFKVYRTASAATIGAVSTSVADYSLIQQIATSSQTASGATTIDDLNLYLPFTSTVYVGELSPQVLTFRQLMPMMKMDLAVNGPAFRWMVLLYGTPLMFTPKKWIRITNVGELSSR